jgi:hypothetical protein
VNRQGFHTGLTPSSGQGCREAVLQQARKRIVLACLAASLIVLSVAAILWLGKSERIAVAANGRRAGRAAALT